MAPDSVDENFRLGELAKAGDQNALNFFRFEREFNAHHLTAIEQLPDIEAEAISVSFDIAEDPPRVTVQRKADGVRWVWDKRPSDGFLYTTLSFCGKELWREATDVGANRRQDIDFKYALPARYAELVSLLRKKYGERLRNIEITDRTEVYFGGLIWEELAKVRMQCESQAFEGHS